MSSIDPVEKQGRELVQISLLCVMAEVFGGDITAQASTILGVPVSLVPHLAGALGLISAFLTLKFALLVLNWWLPQLVEPAEKFVAEIRSLLRREVLGQNRPSGSVADVNGLTARIRNVENHSRSLAWANRIVERARIMMVSLPPLVLGLSATRICYAEEIQFITIVMQKLA